MAMSAPILNAADATSLDEAARLLALGRLVAVPTETVYGLAADASSARAVAGIYEAKGRPRFNPLIAHVDSLERALTLIELPPVGLALARAFWPGPLTLVASIRPAAPVCDLVTAGLDTLAVRWPDAPAMTALVKRLDRPLAAPSANRSGHVSPTTADHVSEGLGDRIALILDGGPCRVGLESTIIAVSEHGATLLRPGGVSRDRIEAITGPLLDAGQEDLSAPQSPGRLASHYAPRAQLRLNVTTPEPGEAYLAFGPDAPPGGPTVINLSPTGDLTEAATHLFASLRALDAVADRIAIAPIPAHGLGEAINDRIQRASTES